MADVVVAEDGSITIPREFVEQAMAKPGDELGVLVKGRHLVVLPVPTLDQLQGIAKGADLTGLREKTDRF